MLMQSEENTVEDAVSEVIGGEGENITAAVNQFLAEMSRHHVLKCLFSEQYKKNCV